MVIGDLIVDVILVPVLTYAWEPVEGAAGPLIGGPLDVTAAIVNSTPRYLGRGSGCPPGPPPPRPHRRRASCSRRSRSGTSGSMLDPVGIALVYYRSAGIPFRRGPEAMGVRDLLRDAPRPREQDPRPAATCRGSPTIRPPRATCTCPLIGTPVSAESLMLRADPAAPVPGHAAVGFPLAFAMHPADFGRDVRPPRDPGRFAFARRPHVPVHPVARGGSPGDDRRPARPGHGAGPRRAGGLIGRMRRTGADPGPDVINAIVGAEDTIDAMDLRGFGTGKRTWLRELRYDRDRTGSSSGCSSPCSSPATVAWFAGLSAQVWVPDAILPQ